MKIIDEDRLEQNNKVLIGTLQNERNEKFRELDKGIDSISKMDTESFIGLMKNQPLLGIEAMKNDFSMTKDSAPFLPNGKIEKLDDLEKVLRVIEKTIPEHRHLWANESHFYDKLFQNISELFNQERVHYLVNDNNYVNMFEDKRIADFFLASKAFCYTSSICDSAWLNSYDAHHFLADFTGEKPIVNLRDSFAYSKNGPIEFVDSNFGEVYKMNVEGNLSVMIEEEIETLEKIKKDYNLNQYEYVSLIANNITGLNFKNMIGTIENPQIFNRILEIPEIKDNLPLFDKILWSGFKQLDVVGKKHEDTMYYKSSFMTDVFPTLYANKLYYACSGLLYGLGLNTNGTLNKKEVVRINLKMDELEAQTLLQAMILKTPELPIRNYSDNVDIGAATLASWVIGRGNKEEELYQQKNSGENKEEAEFYRYDRMKNDIKKDILDYDSEKIVENLKKISERYILPAEILSSNSMRDLAPELCVAFPLNISLICDPGDLSGKTTGSEQFIETYLSAGGSFEILERVQKEGEQPKFW